MRSIKEIFVIGHGPSSSHTMGPAKACEYVLKNYPDAKFVKVTLYGSLAKTGKGHLTDYIINLELKNVPHEVDFDLETKTKHPNTLLFVVTDKDGKEHHEKILSIGGGTIITKDNYNDVGEEIYPHKSLKEIIAYCKDENITLSQYVERFDAKDIRTYIEKCVRQIMASIENGIKAEGELPGNLHVKRKAKQMYENTTNKDIYAMVATSAIAVAEENAAGGMIVIAPTCGSAGVFGGIVGYFQANNYTMEQMVDAMLVAGLIGIICKTNGSVAGAEAGCQAEIGVACSMGAAAIAHSKGRSLDTIAQAAEIALEHSLGLTCDPIQGYVQIPCIERCAIFAIKARTAAKLAVLIPSESSKICFDDSLKTMVKTGRDLQPGYRETSEKGLAELKL